MKKKSQSRNEHKARSVILYRKKSKGDDENLSCFVTLFDMNNPHLLNECPKKILEFNKVNKVVIKDLNVDYLLPGNDLVINNLKHINVVKKDNCVSLSGKQRK